MSDSFKEFYRKKVFTGSPFKAGWHYDEWIENTGLNQESAKELLASENLSKEIYTVLDIPFTKIQKVEHEMFYDYFIVPTPIIRAFFNYTVDKYNNLTMLGGCDHIWSKGTARALLWMYYIPRFRSITFNSRWPSLCQNFAGYIIEKAIKENKRMTVITYLGEYDMNETDKYWNNGPEFIEYKIRIYH